MSMSSTIPGTVRRRRHAREPIKLGVAGGILLMPVLMIAAVVSIPSAWVWRGITKRKEQRFTRRMRLAGRLKSWNEVENFLQEGKGTFIAESLSSKGPSRLWWAPDTISDLSPFPFVTSDNQDRLCYEIKFRPFGNWCFYKYTSPHTGKAFLLDLPMEQRLEIWKRVSEECISTYSRKAWKV